MKSARYFSASISAAALLFSAICFAESAAKTDPAPKAVVEKVTRDAIAILKDPKPTKDEKRTKIKQLADDNVDAEVMARLSLGKTWRTLNDAQKKEFVEEFKKFVVNTYSHTLDEYTDEDVNVTGSRQESDGDVTVISSVVGTKDSGARGEVAKVEYRLRKKGEAWKIIDLNIDGVSLIANFRSQFQDIITNGSVDQLLKLVKEKNIANEKK